MNEQSVKSADRVLEILELFRQRKAPLGVREVAEYFGYPKVSTSVLLKSMAAKGYMSYDRKAHTFVPTMRVALLGDWLHDTVDVGQRVERLVQRLGRMTDETVVVAARNDIWSQVVLVQPSTYEIQYLPSAGSRRPLVFSGTGFALLAAMEDDDIERIYRASRARLFRSDLPHERTLESTFDEIAKVRDNGFALTRGMTTAGATVIVMTLPEVYPDATMVVAVAGISDRVDDKRAAEIVRIMDGELATFVADARQ